MKNLCNIKLISLLLFSPRDTPGFIFSDVFSRGSELDPALIGIGSSRCLNAQFVADCSDITVIGKVIVLPKVYNNVRKAAI